MAKKKQPDGSLPYFKFFTTLWIGKSISDFDLTTQGLFINLCAYYWLDKGKLSFDRMKKKFRRKEKHFSELLEAEILKLDGDKLVITFLDEQLIDLGEISEQNRKIALEGWKQRKADAIALPTHSERNTNAMPKEEIREEEIREEESKSETTTIADENFRYEFSDKNVPREPSCDTLDDVTMWTEQVIANNDHIFSAMVRNEKHSVPIDTLARDHLALCSRYKWHENMTTQQAFRNSLLKHVKEKGNERQTTKGTSGTTVTGQQVSGTSYAGGLQRN